jgi:hypothetical protein
LAFLVVGNHYSKAQEDSTNTQLEIFECYDRYSLKDQWSQVIELVTIISADKPIDMTKIMEATGDYPFAYVKQENMLLFDSIVNLPEIKYLLPADLRFYWSLKSEDRYSGKNYYSLYAIKLTTEGTGVIMIGKIFSAPKVYSAITDSKTEISGSFTMEEA